MADNSSSAEEDATLRYPGGELELKIEKATEGSDGIALGSLLSKSGYTTYDPGFMNTAPTKSAITYIDGDAGILRYRGIPIEQLAEKSTFIEVSYLLIYGELPDKDQLATFTTLIQQRIEVGTRVTSSREPSRLNAIGRWSTRFGIASSTLSSVPVPSARRACTCCRPERIVVYRMLRPSGVQRGE